MIPIVAYGIMGTAYRQEVVVDEGVRENGSPNVLQDIRRQLSMQYGDDTPMTGWALQPASKGMWLTRVERAFDANYAPAYIAIAFLIPQGRQPKSAAMLKLITDTLTSHHSDYIRQSVIQGMVDWRFLEELSEDLEAYLTFAGNTLPPKELSPKYGIAYSEDDITTLLSNLWDDRIAQCRMVFCGRGMLTTDKEFVCIEDFASAEESSSPPVDKILKQKEASVEFKVVDDKTGQAIVLNEADIRWTEEGSYIWKNMGLKKNKVSFTGNECDKTWTFAIKYDGYDEFKDEIYVADNTAKIQNIRLTPVLQWAIILQFPDGREKTLFKDVPSSDLEYQKAAAIRYLEEQNLDVDFPIIDTQNNKVTIVGKKKEAPIPNHQKTKGKGTSQQNNVKLKLRTKYKVLVTSFAVVAALLITVAVFKGVSKVGPLHEQLAVEMTTCYIEMRDCNPRYCGDAIYKTADSLNAEYGKLPETDLDEMKSYFSYHAFDSVFTIQKNRRIQDLNVYKQAMEMLDQASAMLTKNKSTNLANWSDWNQKWNSLMEKAGVLTKTHDDTVKTRYEQIAQQRGQSFREKEDLPKIIPSPETQDNSLTPSTKDPRMMIHNSSDLFKALCWENVKKGRSWFYDKYEIPNPRLKHTADRIIEEANRPERGNYYLKLYETAKEKVPFEEQLKWLERELFFTANG